MEKLDFRKKVFEEAESFSRVKAGFSLSIGPLFNGNKLSFRLRRSRIAEAVTEAKILPWSEGTGLVVTKVAVTTFFGRRSGRYGRPDLWWGSHSPVHPSRGPGCGHSIRSRGRGSWPCLAWHSSQRGISAHAFRERHCASRFSPRRENWVFRNWNEERFMISCWKGVREFWGLWASGERPPGSQRRGSVSSSISSPSDH